jgi:hypothetical protein
MQRLLPHCAPEAHHFIRVIRGQKNSGVMACWSVRSLTLPLKDVISSSFTKRPILKEHRKVF